MKLAKQAGQKLKLLYLKQIFEQETSSDSPLTINEIILKLEQIGINAERKSIYNDIEQLIDFGMDIVSYKTRSTYYYLASREFEIAELKLLVDSVSSSKFLTKKKSSELIKKIGSLTCADEAKQLNRLVYITNRVKHLNERIYYSIDALHEAIINNFKISFFYFDYNLEKEQILRKNGQSYNISPYALISDNENYYLLGFDSDSQIFKHYRVDKMLDVKITSDKRDGVQEFEKIDLGAYSDKMFSMFGGDMINVKLQFENDLIGVVLDRFGKDVMIMKTDENHFIIRVDVAVSPTFFAWIFSLQGKAKILSPSNVKEQMKEHLDKIYPL